MKHIFEDLLWIVAIATWIPELMRKGIISSTYGWFIGIFFIAMLATSRNAHADGGSTVWKLLHAGIPISAMLTYLLLESNGNLNAFWSALSVVAPFLILLLGIYFIIGRFGDKSDD
jgi:fumarate reductase subunit D